MKFVISSHERCIKSGSTSTSVDSIKLHFHLKIPRPVRIDSDSIELMHHNGVILKKCLAKIKAS